MTSIKIIQLYCFILVSALIVVAYAPGLHGPFVFDDVVNITENPAVKITDISLRNLASSVGLDDNPFLGRVLARISFALNYYLAGGNLSPYAFKTTNLIIHIANSWLVYLLALLLFRQLEHRNGSSYTGKYHQWLPCLAAAIWAIHPLQLTSVLYVVQRMTSLSAFFVLAGLIVAILGRQRLQDARPFGLTVMSAGLISGLILGSANKENAILLPLFMLLVEWIFFERATLRQSARKQLWLFYGLILTPYILGLLWLASDPDIILNSYANREFTLFQRLLTEPRVLLYYLQLLLFPRVSELSLFHDDIAISTGFFSPWATLPVLAVLLATAVFSIFRRKEFPILSFSILWYLLGHSIESSIVGLEIAHEHRNYLPSIGPIIGLSYGLILFYSRLQSVVIPVLLSVSILLSLFISTYVRADTWKSEESIIVSMARYHPASSRSQFMMGELYTEKKHDVFKALPHYYKAYELAPHETGYLIRIAMSALSIRSTQVSQEGSDEFKIRRPPATIFLSPMAVEKSGGSGKVSLNREYSTFISDQLKQRSPTENTRQIMFGLSRCLADGVEICQKALPDIIEWYKAVLANPRLNDKHRKDYVISLFEIGLTSRNYGLAFDATRYGKAADPTDPDYTLMEANVYILQNKTDIAEKLIYSVTSSGTDIRNDISNKAAVLLSNINARKKNIEKEKN
jgi:hypothetical protein